MTLNLGVIMDPIESLSFHWDSTLAVLFEAQSRNWQLRYMQPHDLYQKNQGGPWARCRRLHLERHPQHWFELGEAETVRLSSFNVLLMRKEPPVNLDYIYTTHLLEAASRNGTFVVNCPKSLRDCNEKMFATQFPQWAAPFLIAADLEQLQSFCQEQQDVVYKPLNNGIGRGIFRIRSGDTNLRPLLEFLTDNGTRKIMAQRFLPEVFKGDKRILLIDGKPIPHALVRIPPKGEIRSTLAIGGHWVCRPLSESDQRICDQVGPSLREKGLLWVGIDVIGTYLTEINITCPGGMRQLNQGCSLTIEIQLLDHIENQRLSPA